MSKGAAAISAEEHGSGLADLVKDQGIELRRIESAAGIWRMIDVLEAAASGTRRSWGSLRCPRWSDCSEGRLRSIARLPVGKAGEPIRSAVP